MSIPNSKKTFENYLLNFSQYLDALKENDSQKMSHFWNSIQSAKFDQIKERDLCEFTKKIESSSAIENEDKKFLKDVLKFYQDRIDFNNKPIIQSTSIKSNFSFLPHIANKFIDSCVEILEDFIPSKQTIVNISIKPLAMFTGFEPIAGIFQTKNTKITNITHAMNNLQQKFIEYIGSSFSALNQEINKKKIDALRVTLNLTMNPANFLNFFATQEIKSNDQVNISEKPDANNTKINELKILSNLIMTRFIGHKSKNKGDSLEEPKIKERKSHVEKIFLKIPEQEKIIENIDLLQDDIFEDIVDFFHRIIPSKQILDSLLDIDEDKNGKGFIDILPKIIIDNLLTQGNTDAAQVSKNIKSIAYKLKDVINFNEEDIDYLLDLFPPIFEILTIKVDEDLINIRIDKKAIKKTLNEVFLAILNEDHKKFIKNLKNNDKLIKIFLGCLKHLTEDINFQKNIIRNAFYLGKNRFNFIRQAKSEWKFIAKQCMPMMREVIDFCLYSRLPLGSKFSEPLLNLVRAVKDNENLQNDFIDIIKFWVDKASQKIIGKNEVHLDDQVKFEKNSINSTLYKCDSEIKPNNELNSKNKLDNKYYVGCALLVISFAILVSAAALKDLHKINKNAFKALIFIGAFIFIIGVICIAKEMFKSSEIEFFNISDLSPQQKIL